MYILDIDKTNRISPETETDGKKNTNTVTAAPENGSKSNNTILTIPESGNTMQASKTAFVYTLLAIFCALFGGIYECFSHEVYSFFMIYAFAFPLAGGALPFFIIFLIRAKIYPCAAARNLYHSGIATLTVGSILCGVLDIYGTTNSLVQYYFYAGIALTVSGIFIYILQIGKRRK